MPSTLFYGSYFVPKDISPPPKYFYFPFLAEYTISSFQLQIVTSTPVSRYYLPQSTYSYLIHIANYRLYSQSISQQQYPHMFTGFAFFQKQYHKYLRTDFPIDCKLSPIRLIKELKSSDKVLKQFVKALTAKTNNCYKILRRLNVVGLLLIYSKKFVNQIQQFLDQPLCSTNQWLNEHCIKNYYHFLKKIVSSIELYTKIKQSSCRQINFQLMFYIINLFNDLFKLIAKMPLIGRYFKHENQIVVSSFIQCMALQAQKLYMALKNGLMQMLSYPKTYILNRQNQVLLKAILQQNIPVINEQMKLLFFDRYFYPYQKGIGVRLFRPDVQPPQTLKVIKGIVSNHKQTQRQYASQLLQKAIFPQDGKINLQFYQQSLNPSNFSFGGYNFEKNQELVFDFNGECLSPDNQSSINESKCQKSTGHNIEICNDV